MGNGSVGFVCGRAVLELQHRPAIGVMKEQEGCSGVVMGEPHSSAGYCLSEALWQGQDGQESVWCRVFCPMHCE